MSVNPASPIKSGFGLWLAVGLMGLSFILAAQRNRQSQESIKVFDPHSFGVRKAGLTPMLRLVAPFKRTKLVFHINGSFRIRKEYWSASNIFQQKSIRIIFRFYHFH